MIFYQYKVKSERDKMWFIKLFCLAFLLDICTGNHPGIDIVNSLKQNLANLPKPRHNIPVLISPIAVNPQNRLKNAQLNNIWNDTDQKQHLQYLHNEVYQNDFTDCTDLYVHHNDMLEKLQNYIFESKKTTPKPHVTVPERLLFIRKIVIGTDLSQELYFNPEANKLMVNLSKMRLVPLDLFIEWLFVQVDLSKLMLETERTMSDLFRINYKDLIPSKVDDKIDFGVVTFDRPERLNNQKD